MEVLLRLFCFLCLGAHRIFPNFFSIYDLNAECPNFLYFEQIQGKNGLILCNIDVNVSRRYSICAWSPMLWKKHDHKLSIFVLCPVKLNFWFFESRIRLQLLVNNNTICITAVWISFSYNILITLTALKWIKYFF